MRQHHTSPNILRGWDAKKKPPPVSGRNLFLDILFHRKQPARLVPDSGNLVFVRCEIRPHLDLILSK